MLTRDPAMVWSPTAGYDLISESETTGWEDGMCARNGSLCTAAGIYRRWSVLAAAAAGLLFLGNAASAQQEAAGDPNAPAFRLLTTIAINGTAASPNTKMFSFDISWVDPTTNLYFLADRSNAALDVIDTKTNTLFGQIGGAAFNFGG